MQKDVSGDIESEFGRADELELNYNELHNYNDSDRSRSENLIEEVKTQDLIDHSKSNLDTLISHKSSVSNEIGNNQNRHWITENKRSNYLDVQDT